MARTGAQLRFIHAGRPQSKGCAERVQRTVLEKCWRPSFARSMIPKYTALRRDLVQYLRLYNFDRARTGRHTACRTPAQLIYGARKMGLLPFAWVSCGGRREAHRPRSIRSLHVNNRDR